MNKLCDAVARYDKNSNGNSKKIKVMNIARVTGSAMKIVMNDSLFFNK